MAFALVFNVVVGLWLVMEVILQVRDRSWTRLRTGEDRGTTLWLAVGIATGVGLGFVFRAPLAASRGRVLIGLAAALVTVGVLLRLWAVITLGRQFRIVLRENGSATLVTRGPYALIRHPSYAGLIICLAGIGVADGTMWSVLALTLIPLPAFIHRIRVEEAAMITATGSQYEEYRTRTWSLAPRVW